MSNGYDYMQLVFVSTRLLTLESSRMLKNHDHFSRKFYYSNIFHNITYSVAPLSLLGTLWDQGTSQMQNPRSQLYTSGGYRGVAMVAAETPSENCACP